MNRLLRATAPALLALSLASCDSIGGGSSELPVRLTVTPTDTLAPGDSLRMTAYLRNPGREPVRLDFESQCQVEFYVHAPDKTVLHPPGGGTTCIRAPSVLEIAAGDSVRFTASWTATTSMSGPHSAYAVLWEHNVPGDGEPKFDPGHRSNIVEFQVKAAAP
jgi:hypothetical protein